MCCDGTLFEYVPVLKDERPPSPLRILTNFDGGRLFDQGCVALVEEGCGVYTARPWACRNFECMLIDALKDDELDVDSALEIVARAKELVQAVADTLPEPDGKPDPTTTGIISVMRRARRLALEGESTDAHRVAEAWIEIHFLGRKHPNAPGDVE